VKISIYNLVGRQIRELVNEYKEAGFYTIQWDGKNQAGRRVASGTYIYQMRAGGFIQSQKMVVTK